ncbi:hypothetical protein AVEN_182736-1 [Araneus ventricosus]|uniref:Uncharacterized protein n=1 Tax=Araneus ventricosus TaxID=182803 RepID=A0A4Y2PWL7_ARAVE|nr:hypothetical protein AVEN_182736-1 [Araneus ventricosus]
MALPSPVTSEYQAAENSKDDDAVRDAKTTWVVFSDKDKRRRCAIQKPFNDELFHFLTNVPFFEAYESLSSDGSRDSEPLAYDAELELAVALRTSTSCQIECIEQDRINVLQVQAFGQELMKYDIEPATLLHQS